MKKLLLAGWFTIALIGSPTAVLAAGDSGDTSWLLTSTALVLFMTIPGLSLFYAGLVRAKNALSVMMQCFTITCLASLLWLILGYSLVYSDGGPLNAMIGGLDRIFLAGVTRDAMADNIPETVFVMFQLTFAVITPALIVGGFAERMRFSAVVLFSLVWLLLVYFPIAHAVWGGGWLQQLGVLDFAGGLVVHVTAGVSALVAAVVLKKRHGFPTVAMPPHSLMLTVVGAGMLWVGWFGFNAGSAVAANGDAGMAVLVTHISASTASLVWAAIEWIRYGKPSVLGIVTGMVAGLGTITPASGYVGPMGALVIGASAGAVCYFATQAIKRGLKIDDSLDVFPVHGVGGILGTLFAGIFAAKHLGGIGLDVSIGEQMTTQLIGIVFVIIWTVVFTFIALKLVSLFTPLRIDERGESRGLDITQHDESSYHH